MTSSSRSLSLMAAATLIGGVCFAAGSVTAADAGPKPVTTAKVKKIAKKQANKAITKRAPGLTVKRAAVAEDADRLGGQSITTFDVTVTPGGAPQTVATANGVSLIASCPGPPTLRATSSGGGDVIYWYTGGSSHKTGSMPLDVTITGPASGGLGHASIRLTGAEPVTARFGWAVDPISLSCAFTGSLVSR